jgi:hypothetical protein
MDAKRSITPGRASILEAKHLLHQWDIEPVHNLDNIGPPRQVLWQETVYRECSPALTLDGPQDGVTRTNIA